MIHRQQYFDVNKHFRVLKFHMILNPDLVYMYSDLHLNLNLIYVIVIECDLGYSFNQKYDDFRIK